MSCILKQIIKTGILTEPPPSSTVEEWRINLKPLHELILKAFGRAASIRHVDAGSCNGCELEINALHNPYYNIEGLGIHFVASPRHADLLLVTGPVSRNMEVALKRTYESMPDPKLVVAIGNCGCTGGLFGESYATRGAVSAVIPVDVAVPGCPPNPYAILQGVLTAVQQPKQKEEPTNV
ncbi:MAG: NADH-quinone oxidoreductase subunit B family protein [Gammaproteobacteria bacterium]|nr:NADH-quinone oxidoreductase subunit B family protein [Gammaproteobacteria bacterium]